MTASQREPQPQQRSQSRTPAGPHGAEPSGVPMSDLLASCAAASAVSTPPADGSEEEPEPQAPPADATGRRGRAVATR
ncbi:hypothetical protein [Streptomyces sp. NRRL F-5126]|uniref:hypothetical protein n=1 Tax=Streptomyces sp. NRRL F-5126 TaxID=1463857 RepID=UPI0004CC2DFE|nr:hypothetical protein [Streptomyces sp. NRRL F-5126]